MEKSINCPSTAALGVMWRIWLFLLPEMEDNRIYYMNSSFLLFPHPQNSSNFHNAFPYRPTGIHIQIQEIVIFKIIYLCQVDYQFFTLCLY